jgi:cation transport protein ChaC
MADTPAPPAGPGLTRELLLSGALPAMIAATNPEMHVLSDAERNASLEALLACRPERGDGLWVFAYGSLIWNPLIQFTDRLLAHVPGWRRSFCLSVKSGRGTPEAPGLMLGLIEDQPEGPGCGGVVFRIPEAALALELDVLWRREMIAAGYTPRWVAIEDATGARFGQAIAFTINCDGPGYCDNLPEEEVVRRLATAHGRLGSGAEYLFRTQAGLAEMGIVDPFVARLAQLVDRRMKAVA